MVPVHTVVVPVIVPADGPALTAMVVVALVEPQVPVMVYDIVTAPADIPVTTPDALTVALAVLLLLHVPPLVASVSVMLAVGHTLVGPLIGVTELPAFMVIL